ncbi:MAG: virulence-associated E family protein [Eubacterium sp.]|jgi:predicted P-loop ATPase|nr:virulence-associated E family protein [Eubacterium sp.]
MRKLAITTGNSRQSAVWNRSEVSFDELCEKLKNPIRTSETAAQYRKMTRAEKDTAKDKGGFVMGTLKGTRRKKNEVLSRSAITLDEDRLKPDFFDWYKENHKYLSVIYTTHSHTKENPRGRIIIPASRDMTPEETNAIARYMAADLGMDQIDPCSFEINQLMYWPTCSSDGDYFCGKYEGELLDPDKYLASHPDWRDVTKLPLAPGEKEAFNRQKTKQEDPLAKEGIVGDWCRTHSISDVMENVLSSIYEPGGSPDRWHYRKSGSISGVVVYDDKYAYSHHASDPACGKLLNSFDLVRIHLFYDDDPKKSFNMMAEYASNDKAVRDMAMKRRQEQAAAEFAPVSEEDDSWKESLEYSKKDAKVKNTLGNLRIIVKNDRYLKNIWFNKLSDSLEVRGELPWKHPEKYWRDADDAQLICYVDANYGTFSRTNYDTAVTKVADDRGYHPIREYFDNLPEWDGIKRADTLLIDYLGAEDTPYVRAVTRKTLCAARRRILVPGVKFDFMPVLNGPQGIGKSTLISKLAMEWYSDSLNISDMNDKTAAEKLQGYWILEIGELAGMKKADLDKVKAFISRQDDKYRASFGRRVTPHPRQCVFFGTTNSENGYLRDITGNRRYWNIKVDGKGKYHSWQLDQDIVDQIWAEVKLLEPDEPLYLPPELEEYAKDEQRQAMESDDREGLVREYLDTLLPSNWDDMDFYARRTYIHEPDDPAHVPGTVRRMTVSNIEIWCECFGKPKEDIRYSDSYAISSIMAKIESWEKTGKLMTLPIYGRQRIYRRK